MISWRHRNTFLPNKAICNRCSAHMPNFKSNTGLTNKSRHSGMMRALRNRWQLSELQDHHSTFTHRSYHQGKSRSQLKGSQLKRTTMNQLKGAIMSQFCLIWRAIQDAWPCRRQFVVEEESAACNSIANCNCSVYSYHSVASFGSALHQKHWHRKHLRWAPEQRRASKAPFSASLCNV